MKHLPRILMVIGALSLLGLFVFPLWRIVLEAPQYPGGVTMYIWINKLGGDGPGTLQNVNILNHYVGMKHIEPDSISELQYFPYIVIGLVVLGLIAAFTNRRWLFLSWVVLLVLLGAAGVYDFYLWEYDYGHNLSPEAPIKIPEASFQPPLVGRKVILNFVATSLPHTGAIFVALAMFFGLGAWWLKGRRQPKSVEEVPEGSQPSGDTISEATVTAGKRSSMVNLALLAGLLAGLGFY
jgi:copper chaperone NosL